MPAVEIIPLLWIGDKDDAYDINFIQDNNIDIVINCTSEIPYPKWYKDGDNIKYLRYPFRDNPNQNGYNDNHQMFEELNNITDYIHEHLLQLKSILVHCHLGKQRSPTVIAGYLMRFGKMDLNNAMQCLEQKKNDVFKPSPNFYPALKKFEKLHGL